MNCLCRLVDYVKHLAYFCITKEAIFHLKCSLTVLHKDLSDSFRALLPIFVKMTQSGRESVGVAIFPSTVFD